MAKEIIRANNAPGAIGPYSQGVSTGTMIYTSGQLPIDVNTGDLELYDIKKATARSLDNIKAILESKGVSMENVIKTTVFLTDLADFNDMNEIYGAYFTSDPPARSCVEVAALPKGAKIEIEAVATTLGDKV